MFSLEKCARFGGILLFCLLLILSYPGSSFSQTQYDLIINEIMYAGYGDSNGDGVTNMVDDEFIEFVNVTGSDLDISNWSLWICAHRSHVFPPGTVLTQNQAIIVFSGGTPTGSFGGSIAQVCNIVPMNMVNSGERIRIFTSSDDSVLLWEWSSLGAGLNATESYCRCPDITGDDSSFTEHSSMPGSGGAPFSPGTQSDGDEFLATVPLLNSQNLFLLGFFLLFVSLFLCIRKNREIETDI